jgi:hypothetical protein
VDSVWVDPATNLPPDVAGRDPSDTEGAVRKQVCPECVEKVKRARLRAGKPAWEADR